MQIASLLQPLMKNSGNPGPIVKSFQPGQIVFGKIAKLFPNGIAQVQIGNEKVIAQLAAPLEAGTRYWLQVQPGEGKVHLKVLSVQESVGAKDGPQSIQGLLKQMNLPQSKENLATVKYFIGEQLPLTKDVIGQTSSLLANTNDLKESLQIIKQMVLNDLPLTKDAFSAISVSTKNDSMQTMLQSLENLLDKNPKSNTGDLLIKAIKELTSTGQEKVSQQVTTQLLNIWLGSKTQAESLEALKLLQNFSLVNNQNELELVQQLTGKILNDPRIALKEQDLFELKSLMLKDELSALKASLHSLLNKADISSQQLLSLLSENGKMDDFLKQVDFIKPLFQTESTLITNILNEIQREVVKWEDKNFLVDHLKGLTKSIGLGYESELIQFLKGTRRDDTVKNEIIKSLLIQLIKENPQSSLKEASDALLNKITGTQLLSHETGPIQQYVMQVPLSFWNKTTELTVQWSGQKKENGEIDSNYCRVLFYLELEYINEVIVDMQIQNRILVINIFNDTEGIKNIAAPFLSSLKENLAKLNYQLSSVHFQNTQVEKVKEKRKALELSFDSNQVNGVDIRI